MSIVIAGNASIKVRDNHWTVTLSDLTERDGDDLPPGSVINPDLADPHSSLRIKLDQGLHQRKFDMFEIGPVRLGVGGLYSVDLSSLQLNYHHPRLTTQEGIRAKLNDRLQGFISSVSPVVFRTWGAPATQGCFDGGGAGRLEKIPDSPNDFVWEMLGENYGEIGPVITMKNGVSGRCCLDIEGMPSTYSDRLDAHIVEEWVEAHGSAPSHIANGAIRRVDHQHSLCIDRFDDPINGIVTAFEFPSASLECLIHTQLLIQKLPDGARIGFTDLERRGDLPLNRPIGALLKLGATASPQLAMIQYINGYFDPRSPLLPITAETAKWLGNEKFHAVVKMARSL